MKNETGLPEKLKILLVQLKISFNSWCGFYGFNIATARQVAGGRLKAIRGDKTISINNALKNDFPFLFNIEKDGLKENQEKVALMKAQSYRK